MYQRLFLGALLIAVVAIYFDFRGICLVYLFPPQPNFKKVFTQDELKLYNGVHHPQLYLSILGKVFNVTKGAQHYGPGGSYHFFVGRDSSRSFVTGKFEENEADDRVSDLSPEELRSLNHWVHFYGKEYKKIGVLTGRYYDAAGKLTRYGKEVRKLIKAAENAKQSEEVEKMMYPPCNVEWDADRGSRVWCTNRSGGILRDWIGVPRQLYEPGSRDYRCACIQLETLGSHGGNLKEYEGCHSDSVSCFVK